jgi:hypothetical protein
VKIHPDVTIDAITEACERQMFGTDNPGFCVACGNEQGGCEPDAAGYECEACGEKQVYGAQELLFHVVA